MGKKSKRRQSKPSMPMTAASNTQQPASNPNLSGGSHQSSVITRLHPNLPLPEGGWAEEHRASEKALKKVEKSVSSSSSSSTTDTVFAALVRACHANRMLRQWERLKILTGSALTALSENSEETNNRENADIKKELLIYQNEASIVLNRRSSLNKGQIQAYLKQVASRAVSGNKDVFAALPFSNLNCLHYAAMYGDVQLMEKLVSLGVAIDYPPPQSENSRTSNGPGEPAPPDCSALVLACAFLAQSAFLAELEGFEYALENINESLSGVLECAIQLVRLGADSRIKLVIPNHLRGRVVSIWRQFDFNNKTAKELAIMSGRSELTDIMEKYQDPQSRLDIIHCRCGSRLTWKDCHLGMLPSATIANANDEEDGRYNFRFSPLALCPCNGPKKKAHFNCCWESSEPIYQDDCTAKLYCHSIVTCANLGGDQEFDAMMDAVQRLSFGRGSQPNAKLFGDITAAQLRDILAQGIRSTDIFSSTFDSNPKMRKMDPEVYAGILERIESWFPWRDDHWAVDKVELLKRVSDWNQALARYCNDMNISGERRKEIYNLHEASPYAPCANLTCKKIETKVKGFARCSKCRTVAYCSPECQKMHWKTHKMDCIAR